MTPKTLPTWAAGLLIMTVTACTPTADRSVTSQPSKPATVWRGFTDGCPTLNSPPYGIDPTGKRRQIHVGPGEQENLDQVVPGADIDRSTCQYSTFSTLTPNLTTNLKIFRGETGTAQARALFQKQQSSASAAGANYADVPALGDSGFAWYAEPWMVMTVLTGNAYVVVNVTPGAEASKTFDKLRPLQQQLPTLAGVMKEALATLQ